LVSLFDASVIGSFSYPSISIRNSTMSKLGTHYAIGPKLGFWI